jgi:hypothetical protein
MKTDLDEIYRPLAAALILGIMFAAAFNSYMRWTIGKGEGFTELYFNDHKELQKDMELNNTYNVSFTFTNHELKPETYMYGVESAIINLTHGITLAVGDSATITLQATPQERTWNITWYAEVAKTEALNATGDANITLRFKVIEFGEVLHENLTFEELKKKPINIYQEKNQTLENITKYAKTNQTLKAEGRNVIVETIEKTVEKTVAQKPIIIKVYKEGTKPDEGLEIHYWYEAR